MTAGAFLYGPFRRIKAAVEAVPGAHRAWKWLTSRTGEGRVYRIRRGPMAGTLWRRRNALPFWYHLGIYEVETSRFLQAHLRPGESFWDLGANAGYHTLLASRAVGPQGRVIAVEPDPGNCATLRDQLALNGVANCTVVQAAVADRTGTARLVLCPSDTRTHALQEIDNPAIDNRGGEIVEVPTLTLDDLAARFGRPSLVKMDVEGSEVLALPGGGALLSGPGRPPRLLIATHGAAARAFCRDFLRGLGYALEGDAELDGQSLVAVDPARRPA